MRLVRSSHRQLESAAGPSGTAETSSDLAGDALASACLFGIVGGLIFAVAVVPTISAVLVGAAIGFVAGVLVAYH